MLWRNEKRHVVSHERSLGGRNGALEGNNRVAAVITVISQGQYSLQARASHQICTELSQMGTTPTLGHDGGQKFVVV